MISIWYPVQNQSQTQIQFNTDSIQTWLPAIIRRVETSMLTFKLKIRSDRPKYPSGQENQVKHANDSRHSNTVTRWYCSNLISGIHKSFDASCYNHSMAWTGPAISVLNTNELQTRILKTRVFGNRKSTTCPMYRHGSSHAVVNTQALFFQI